ncbi:type II toxin-antitoxin system PemK/MazF family toxin [Lachnospiraceae bacterium]|nr:type II toxin-antitoxin system PemK/MazF family toxin [Lachnospiraceae bacterium]
MERTIKRGDIYYAELNPVIDSEQGGTRPVLIISNDTGNRHSPTIIIAAITGQTQTKAKLLTHTEVKDFEALDRDSIVLLEQIRTVDKKRLKQYMCMMPAEAMARVDKALAISIGIS